MADIFTDIIIILLIFLVSSTKISYLKQILLSLVGLISVIILRYYYHAHENSPVSLYFAIGIMFYTSLVYYRSFKKGISIFDQVSRFQEVDKKPLTWNWVSFWLATFWPFGMILLYGKIEIDKPNINRKCKAVLYASYALFGQSIIVMILAYSDYQEAWFGIVYYLLGGILTYRTAKKIINGTIAA